MQAAKHRFSGHDTGPMMPLLAAFNVWDGIWTPYASLISWELYSKNNTRKLSTQDYVIRFVYNGQVMQVPGCSDELCNLDEFLSVAESLVPTASECDVSAEEMLEAELEQLRVAKRTGLRVRWTKKSGSFRPQFSLLSE